MEGAIQVSLLMEEADRLMVEAIQANLLMEADRLIVEASPLMEEAIIMEFHHLMDQAATLAPLILADQLQDQTSPSASPLLQFLIALAKVVSQTVLLQVIFPQFLALDLALLVHQILALQTHVGSLHLL